MRAGAAVATIQPKPLYEFSWDLTSTAHLPSPLFIHRLYVYPINVVIYLNGVNYRSVTIKDLITDTHNSVPIFYGIDARSISVGYVFNSHVSTITVGTALRRIHLSIACICKIVSLTSASLFLSVTRIFRYFICLKLCNGSLGSAAQHATSRLYFVCVVIVYLPFESVNGN